MQVGIMKMTDDLLVYWNVSQNYWFKTEKRKFWCRCCNLEGPLLLSVLSISAMRGVNGLALAKKYLFIAKSGHAVSYQ